MNEHYTEYVKKLNTIKIKSISLSTVYLHGQRTSCFAVVMSTQAPLGPISMMET